MQAYLVLLKDFLDGVALVSRINAFLIFDELSIGGRFQIFHILKYNSHPIKW